MGWQNITEIFYGVALPDDKADVVYGLCQRYTSAHAKLPGDVDVERSRQRDVLPLVMPSEEQDGRRWIGVCFSVLHEGLPTELRGQVYSVTDPAIASFVKAAHHEPSAHDVQQAAPVWERFAAWCKRRGVDLPPASIRVVADYD